MGREQRRLSRRSDARNTRTPVRVKARPGLRIPLGPIAAIGAVAAVVLLVVYLIVQSRSPAEDPGAVPKAARDDSPELPGNYAPWQGVQHLTQQMNADYTPIMPFCDGVPHSGVREAAADITVTPVPSPTPARTAAAASTTTSTGTPGLTATPANECYNSNPPSSGRHFGVQRPAEIAPGISTNIPPDPDVYPRDVDVPREAVPHIGEHSGVFVGYNCAADDEACFEVVAEVEDIVNRRIDNNRNRVTMMYFSDLPFGEIGLSSITRWDRFHYTDFNRERVTRFIAKHACRYDSEGFC